MGAAPYSPKLAAAGGPPGYWIWLVIAAGMALRIGWALVFPVEPTSDSFAYHTFARNIVDHGVYGWTPDEPGAYWPVGTSAIVAATYALLGDTFAGVVATNLLAAFVTLVLVNRLGTVYFGGVAGFWATVAVAFWPNLIYFTTILSSELYFMALALAGVHFWERATARADRWGGWGHVLLCGLALGAACYVRPIALFIPATLALVGLVQGPRVFLGGAVRALAVTLILIAVVAPWSYRNYTVFGERVFVSTNFGPVFWMGNNPETSGGYMSLPGWVRGMSQTERADALKDEAMQYIRDEPLAFVGRTALKALRLHERETIGVAWNNAAIERQLGSSGLMLMKVLATGYWYVILAAGLLGVWRLGQERFWSAFFNPAFAIWAYVTLLHAIILVQDRYHMPSTPFIAMLAGVAVAAWLHQRQDRVAHA